MLSAFIFTCNVVLLLIGIVLELLRGCLHHGPRSCPMFKWSFAVVTFHGHTSMVIFMENVNLKTFGPFIMCKSNVDQEE